jgi:hypothetical protein
MEKAEGRKYTKKSLPLGSGFLRKAADLIIGRPKKIDEEVEKATGGKKKKK